MKTNTLLEAISFNEFKQFKTLLVTASVKERSTALIDAARRGKTQYLSLLLPAKANVKREALMEAIRMGQMSCITALLPSRVCDSEALCCVAQYVTTKKRFLIFCCP